MRLTLGHPRHRAFTFLELIFVLVLISVIIGIVVPILNHTARGREVGDTAAQIVTLCNYARTQSISEGRPYRLNFDPNGNAYWLSVQNGAQYSDVGTDFGQQFKPTDAIRIATDLPRNQDGIYVTFKSSGRVDPAPVNVRVTDENGGLTEVTCESATELFHVVVR